MTIEQYTNLATFNGWSRIDMLLEIYDCAISSFQQAKSSLEAENELEFAQHFIKGQKAILAIHAGLKPDEHDIAFNIARLLHFVLQKIEERDFDSTITVLTSMRSGFAAIQNEANQLESKGEIPSMPTDEVLNKAV